MKSIDTETVKCSRCGVELDIPVYQDNRKTKYGMKYCHQCGAKLHEEIIQLSDLKEALKLIREYKVDNSKQREQIAEYKRLLKMAVEDFKEIISSIMTCEYCKWYSEDTNDCTYLHGDVPCEKICGWKHEGEVLKLIGETNDES